MLRWIWAAVALAVVMTSVSFRAIDAHQDSNAGPVTPLQTDGGRIAGLSPNGARIAVVTYGSSLCIFDAITLEETSCAPLDRLDSDPASDGIVWSPDSTRLAIAEIGLLLGKDGDLWVMDAASGDLTNLTDDGYSGYLPTVTSSDPAGEIFIDMSPAWTPDGQSITFSRSSWIDGSAAGTTIAQVPAAGGEVDILATVSETEPGVVRSRTAWSPDGTTFYFTREANNETTPTSNGIWSLTAATGEFLQVASGYDPALGVLSLLEVSPAGNQLLAWYPEAHGQFEVDSTLLRLIDVASGDVSTPIIPEDAPVSRPGMSMATFAPDGSGLLLLLPTLGASDQLWLATPADADPVLVLDELGVDTGQTVDWANNGTVLVGGLHGQGAVTSIATQSAPPPAPEASPLTHLSFGAGQVLGGSPDGTKAAVLKQRVSLCIVEIATNLELSCASLADKPITPRPEDVIWSPDGTRIAFTELGFVLGTDSDLWVMEVTTGALTNLTDDGFDGDLFGLGGDLPASVQIDASPAWTPDGQFITFARTGWDFGESTGTMLARISAGGGPVEELTRVSETEPGVVVHRSAWSPDGSTLYYTYSSALADDPGNGVWAYDSATGLTAPLVLSDGLIGGAPALLQVSPSGDQLLVWYPQVFVGTQIADPLIRLVDTATGEITLLELPPPGQATLPARIVGTFSPDGQSLLFLLVPAGNSGQLWVSDPLTGEATRVVDSIEGAKLDPRMAPTWSANGTVVIGLIDSSAVVTTISGIDMETAASLRELVTSHNPGWDANTPETAQ